MNISLAYLAPSIVLLLGGCTSLNTPGDLAFTSAKVVDWQDQAELPGQGAKFVPRMVGDLVRIPIGETLVGGKKWHRPLVKVEFTSKTDLWTFKPGRTHGVRGQVRSCDGSREFGPVTEIFWRGILLDYQFLTDPIEPEPANQLFTYYGFIYVEDVELQRNHNDVCFRLRASSKGGFGYSSNELMVPRVVIDEAVRKIPRDSE